MIMCSSGAAAAWWTGDTVAVVTGANRGIGHALAAHLAEQGLCVVVTARDEARGQAAAAALRRGAGPPRGAVRFRRLDVADPASIAAFASWLRDELGGLDILVSLSPALCAPSPMCVDDAFRLRGCTWLPVSFVTHVYRFLADEVTQSPN